MSVIHFYLPCVSLVLDMHARVQMYDVNKEIQFVQVDVSTSTSAVQIKLLLHGHVKRRFGNVADPKSVLHVFICDASN